MENKIHVQPLGRSARFWDWIMIPIMYLVSGTFKGSPQQTHCWNNTKLRVEEVRHLAGKDMVQQEGVYDAGGRWWIKWLPFLPWFHIPIFGGWRDYVVLDSKHSQEWHVGWICRDVVGISQIKICGPVRLLLGSGNITFFGLSVDGGQQISIYEIGKGRIGKGGPHAHVPLL